MGSGASATMAKCVHEESECVGSTVMWYGKGLPAVDWFD